MNETKGRKGQSWVLLLTMWGTESNSNILELASCYMRSGQVKGMLSSAGSYVRKKGQMNA